MRVMAFGEQRNGNSSSHLPPLDASFSGQGLGQVDHVGLSALESALDLEPRNAAVYWDCALALIELGRSEQALQYVRTGLRYSPGDPQGVQLLSSLQTRLRKQTPAK